MAPPVRLLVEPATAKIIAYGRVSTEDQSLDVQLADFARIGAQKIFVEKISGQNAKRPMFDLMMKYVERGDTVYFHSLSRFSRGVESTLASLRRLKEIGAEWRSIVEPYCDDKTASGKFMTHFTASKDELEVNQLSERTVRGINEKRAQGMWIGRKATVSPADARKMVTMRKRGMTGEEIADAFDHLKIKASTVYARTNALMRAKKS